ncbi:MAG: VCP-like ATPase [Candidatus Micrarchaeota archaeon]|nr:MAG: VCP-like ATPase [Candidatus Micrarchaeota archaeon]
MAADEASSSDNNKEDKIVISNKVLKPFDKNNVDPEAKAHYKIGNELFLKLKYYEAKEEYTKAIQIQDNYADAYFNRAVTYKSIKDYQNAEEDIKVVLALQPDAVDAMNLYGEILLDTGRLKEAEEWFKKALMKDPSYERAAQGLKKVRALLYEENEESDDTEEEVEEEKEMGGSKSSIEEVINKKEESYKEERAFEIEKLLQEPHKNNDISSKEEDVIQEGQIKKVAFFKPTETFDSVVGMEKIKQYFRENVILAIKNPQLFKKYGKKLGVGVILYGPPGTGKTYIVRAAAGEAGANVIIARINQIVDMYTGNTEKNLHSIFEQARKNTPCIIIFDELDALGIKRNDSGQGESSSIRLAINQFLTEMDGLEKNPEGIFVIGTTNNPWDIDPALKRSGRFGDRIYIRPPNKKERMALFEFYTANTPKEKLNYGRLARATIGYSAADIADICEKAKMRPLLHEYYRKKERKLTTKDIIAVLKDKEFGRSNSSLDEWYETVKKDVINKVETEIVNGKKQQVVKEGKLDPEERILYKALISDIKKNTSKLYKLYRWLTRFIAVYLF